MHVAVIRNRRNLRDESDDHHHEEVNLGEAPKLLVEVLRNEGEDSVPIGISNAISDIRG